MSESLSNIEQHLLDELMQFHATRSHAETKGMTQRAVEIPRFRQPMRRSHYAQNVVVFAAMAAVGVFLVVRGTGWLGSGPALAATPAPLRYTAPGPNAPSGRAVLLQLANTAAQQRVDPVPTGAAYAYVKTIGWYLTVGPGGPGVGDVFPQTSQSWLKQNGSGLVVNATGRGSHRQVNRVHPGSGPRLLHLSRSPSVLAEQLAVGHPRSDGPQEQFVAFTDTASQQPITPSAEAGILRLLARSPGLTNRGTVTDRMGRRGVAVSLDSARLGNRYTLILDPHTGRLLGFEQTLLGGPRKLHVRPNAVLAYTTIVNTGYVTTTTSTP